MCVDKGEYGHETCSISNGEQCPICMDDITDLTGFVQTPCGHKFGADCFITYLATFNSMHGSASTTHPTCPMCRQDLTLPHPVQEDTEYPQYVILPLNTNADNECGHHLYYHRIMHIINLRHGESVKCWANSDDCESYCQYVIYQRPRNGQALEEASPDVRLQVFAQSYNVLRIMSGLGGLAYSS
jgi:hypothetical protein